MSRRIVGSLLLACLLVLAGCNGGTEPATTTGPNATTTAAGGPPEAIYDTPLTASTVLDRHAETLASNGTFTYRQNTTLRFGETDSPTFVTNVTAAVDLDEGTTLVLQNATPQGKSVAYGSAAVGYQRVGTGDGADYRTAPENVTDPAFYQRPPLDRYLQALNYTYDGVERRNGTYVFTYVTEGAEQLTAADGSLGPIPAANVTEVSSRVSIRADGRIDSFRYSARGSVEGQRRSYTLALDWTAVGTTTVTEPAWVSEARNATNR